MWHPASLDLEVTDTMATNIDNSEDILDVRDIIERVEELEEGRKAWVAGWNMPGYMPDNEPAAFGTWEDARDYLIEELDREAEQDEAGQEDRAASDYAHAADTLRALSEGSEFGSTVGSYHYWLTTSLENGGFETPEEFEEYNTLTALLKDLKGYGGDHEWNGDWYPVGLIRDSYFEDYAKELVEDIGDMPKGLPSYIAVDWKATAQNIQVDYSSVEFDGVTYWYR